MKVLRRTFKCSTPGKTKTVKVILPSKYRISNSFHCVCIYSKHINLRQACRDEVEILLKWSLIIIHAH